MIGIPILFDQRALRLHRQRAANRFDVAARPLVEEVSGRLFDRLRDIRRRFPMVVQFADLSPPPDAALCRTAGIETLIQVSPMAAKDTHPVKDNPQDSDSPHILSLAAEEEVLPLAEASVDLVIDLFNLHWVNDLPGALAQIRRALKPDGLFLAALFSGETLKELREAFLAAESEAGGASPRIAPMMDIRDAGNLLLRAGFSLPVCDQDNFSLHYRDAFALMTDLRAMGETNALAERHKGASRRATLMRMAEIYQQRFGNGADGITASFQVLYLTAWAPHPVQQKPLRPGSATMPLAKGLDQAQGDDA